MNPIRFGIITDKHYRTGLDQVFWTFFDDQYRNFVTADERFSAAIAEFQSQSVDFAIQGGDAIDAGSTDPAADMATMIATSEGYTNGNFWHALGNHEGLINFNGGAYETRQSFWDAVDGAANAGARENEWNPDGDGTLAYTFEYKGVRFVVLYADAQGNLDGPDGTSELTWLEDTALNTTMPIVVFSHGLLFSNDYSYAFVDNHAAVRTLLEAAKVQVVFHGHFHRNQIPGYGALYTEINDILYVPLRGSVLGANDGDDESPIQASDSAYYIIEIEPNAVGTSSGHMKPNIEITAYLQGTSRSYNSYGVFSS